MTGFVLCADDYALSQSIDDGIISLLERGRLSAVSCMTTTPRWSAAALRLLPYLDKIDIGLHLNFTEGSTLTLACKSKPLWACILQGRLLPSRRALYFAEIAAQWQRFVTVMGRAPDFIDGHQHVHILPQVRHALIEYLAAQRNLECYVRVPYNLAVVRPGNCPIRFDGKNIRQRTASNYGLLIEHKQVCLKQRLLPILGARALHRQLVARSWHYNRSFAGMYNFKQTNYRQVFQQALRQVQVGGLVMCHPGLQPAGMTSDTLAAARKREWDYFNSADYVVDCQQAGLQPMRMRAAMLL